MPHLGNTLATCRSLFAYQCAKCLLLKAAKPRSTTLNPMLLKLLAVCKTDNGTTHLHVCKEGSSFGSGPFPVERTPDGRVAAVYPVPSRAAESTNGKRNTSAADLYESMHHLELIGGWFYHALSVL
eukprot:TRINITY_DN109374_c0_g1_i1.p2 TRINITY_DN109374_c0_g1~~TRINITY_DN109374_c0_g1_i1.p2  ORF type:complete len:126 (-),score=20.99 TRINITY_DN109374_c0_g1_i1:2-379(-)